MTASNLAKSFATSVHQAGTTPLYSTNVLIAISLTTFPRASFVPHRTNVLNVHPAIDSATMEVPNKDCVLLAHKVLVQIVMFKRVPVCSATQASTFQTDNACPALETA